jgi:hypothetical protein
MTSGAQAKGKFSAQGRLERASGSPSGDPTRDLTVPAMGHRFESTQLHQPKAVNQIIKNTICLDRQQRIVRPYAYPVCTPFGREEKNSPAPAAGHVS